MKNRIHKYVMAAICLLLLSVPCSVVADEIVKQKAPHEKTNPWETDRGRVIYDGTYPPPQAYPPPHPYHPRPPGYSPYYCYPPYYQPNTPWYENEMPDSAGRLAILVDPVQAKVYVNGYPLERKDDLAYEAGLLSGEYKVEVQAEGYESHRQEVEIRGGERVRLTVRLKRIASGSK